MKHTCPKCGHISEIEPQQKRAAKSRWSKMTKKQRSEEMKRVRAKGAK
jgi:ssDNA-binding Zn-finger/Zn-ribbon topoisomerase 1